MKVVGLIPIKLNSKRLTRKNIKLLNNKPLCQYLFDTVKNMKDFDEIYCYCSDDKIIEYLPPEIIFLKRKESLDADSISMNTVIDSFISEIAADIYVLLHVTSPFITINTISSCITNVKNKNYDSAFSAKKIKGFLWKNKQAINFDPANIPRTQDLTSIYEETSSIYVFKKDIFINYNRRVGFNYYIHIAEFKETIDIDTLDDFNLAEKLCNIIL